jgi:hypothetical protein
VARWDSSVGHEILRSFRNIDPRRIRTIKLAILQISGSCSATPGPVLAFCLVAARRFWSRQTSGDSSRGQIQLALSRLCSRSCRHRVRSCCFASSSGLFVNLCVYTHNAVLEPISGVNENQATTGAQGTTHHRTHQLTDVARPPISLSERVAVQRCARPAT